MSSRDRQKLGLRFAGKAKHCWHALAKWRVVRAVPRFIESVRVVEFLFAEVGQQEYSPTVPPFTVASHGVGRGKALMSIVIGVQRRQQLLDVDLAHRGMTGGLHHVLIKPANCERQREECCRAAEPSEPVIFGIHEGTLVGGGMLASA